MTSADPAYFEFIDFIAAGTTPEKIIAFRPSAVAQQHVKELIAREKDQRLSPDEQSELDYFFQLEHIFCVAKARAEQMLARPSSRLHGRARQPLVFFGSITESDLSNG